MTVGGAVLLGIAVAVYVAYFALAIWTHYRGYDREVPPL